MLLKLLFTRSMKILDFSFIHVKKSIETHSDSVQQSVIATHSFQLLPLRGKKARKSLQVKDKDSVTEVRPKRVLEMPYAALKFKSKKFVLAKW